MLHTVLLHRSTGKFHYKKEGTYSIGTVGTQDWTATSSTSPTCVSPRRSWTALLRKVTGNLG